MCARDKMEREHSIGDTFKLLTHGVDGKEIRTNNTERGISNNILEVKRICDRLLWVKMELEDEIMNAISP